MGLATTTLSRTTTPPAGRSYTTPLIYVTSLFFLWGLAYGLLDVLNKHFQETLGVGKAESAWLQAAYFGAYFLVSWPAGRMMTRFGYKRGILVGLGLYALGAFLFIPAAWAASFPFFVGSLFVLASGLACLETAANPYVTVLGPPETAERRLNLSQSFNGVGSFIGPLIGGALFFGVQPLNGSGLHSVQLTYAAIGVVVLLVAALIARTWLPEVHEPEPADIDAGHTVSLLHERHFVFGVIAQFFYVAAQVGVGAFFINMVTENWPGMSSSSAAYLLSVGMLLFLGGRFLTAGLMGRFSPSRILAIYGVANVVLTIVVALSLPRISTVALVLVFFFMSIMFPTIFSLGVKRLGSQTKNAASAMVAAVVGGAVIPPAMGLVAQSSGTGPAYLLPTVCFIVVTLYGWKGSAVRPSAIGGQRLA